MITAYMNPQGIYTCLSPEGVFLSYPIDANNMVEVSFPSSGVALKHLNVSSLMELSGYDLIAYSLEDPHYSR